MHSLSCRLRTHTHFSQLQYHPFGVYTHLVFNNAIGFYWLGLSWSQATFTQQQCSQKNANVFLICFKKFRVYMPTFKMICENRQNTVYLCQTSIWHSHLICKQHLRRSDVYFEWVFDVSSLLFVMWSRSFDDEAFNKHLSCNTLPTSSTIVLKVCSHLSLFDTFFLTHTMHMHCHHFFQRLVLTRTQQWQLYQKLPL